MKPDEIYHWVWLIAGLIAWGWLCRTLEKIKDMVEEIHSCIVEGRHPDTPD